MAQEIYTNRLDYIFQRVKRHLRDVSITDAELKLVIDDVITDIAVRSKVFKKAFGFNIHQDIKEYNFKYIARLNEQVEYEPLSITVNSPAVEEIIEFIQNEGGNFPNPIVEKDLIKEEAQPFILDVLDIIDEEGYSVSTFFTFVGNGYSKVYSDTFLMEYDKRPLVFVASIVPAIFEMNEEDILPILPAINAGVKFFINDKYASARDVQVTNYDFMRYHQAIQQLRDSHPNNFYGTTLKYRRGRWL